MTVLLPHEEGHQGRPKANRWIDERPVAASNPPTDPRIHFCRHALRERSIASAAGGVRGRDRRRRQEGKEG